MMSLKRIPASISQEVLDGDEASEEGLDLNEDDDGASKEGSDDDDDGAEEGSDEDDDDRSSEEGSGDDDDASKEGPNDDDSDDGGKEKSPLNQSNVLKDGSLTVGNLGMRCNNVASETEVSNVDNDDAPQGDSPDDTFEDDQGDDDASSLVSKSMTDADQTVENGDTGRTSVASVTGTFSDLIKEIQPVKETMDVNGFQVLPSQADSVSHIFKRHPDIALAFRPKNQQIRRAYMNELLSLIEMLCQSPEKHSEDDLRNADEKLVDLVDVGFKLDWLKTKLNEVSEKKKIEQGSRARLRTMEEQLQKLKLMFLDLETQLQKEKTEALAAKTPLSFNDVVC